ncbi:pentapeptide repeat-containing protein [Pseudomarimonas arenosa]|uniref:Pentapeptide repeat-containing protein n=1 Tax=Pseudomarimonas arenosa TaxID=2774145 RepID=A0AAW3ZR86_9GAMM|nr:pentapeptide repeat-containing protein [Pseudomarimonas arenosa]MBD8527077.1 pentapeptide repeat-containing protein [Pseudomarimonas arenosa]
MNDSRSDTITDSARIQALEATVEELQTSSIGQEHRLVQVARNAYLALLSRPGWTGTRRLEAGGALVRYMFLGRTTLVLGLSLGGLLALHASFMLADQNKKLDLQNYLSIVSGELAEAQRNSQFVQLIAPLIADLQTHSATAERSANGAWTLPPELAIRIAVLTQTFQPYRWIHRDMLGDDVMESTGSGWIYRVMTGVRSLYDDAFGQPRLRERLGSLKIPALTDQRMSPERGFLLVNLHALRISFPELTRWNVTFESAHAPGARLGGIDLRRLEGPDAAGTIDLSGSNLNAASFERAWLDGVSLIMSNLTLAQFDGAQCAGTLFEGATLDQASFIAARLERAKFNHAYIGDSNFRLANLAGADLMNVRGLTDAKLSEACMSRQSTQMPSDFVWSAYTVPDECCELWSGQHEAFARRGDGTCAAIDAPIPNLSQ